MERETIRAIFGKQKLIGADVGVIRSLTALGPWGIALIAAYIAGQGLVQLAEKIQAMRGPSAPAIPLTGEEERQIRDAIQAIETESFAQTHPEIMEWIKEHSPAQSMMLGPTEWPVEEIDARNPEEQAVVQELAKLQNEIGKVIGNPPPKNTRCAVLDHLEKQLEQFDNKVLKMYPMAGPQDFFFHQWNEAVNYIQGTIGDLKRKWGCYGPPVDFHGEAPF